MLWIIPVCLAIYFGIGWILSYAGARISMQAKQRCPSCGGQRYTCNEHMFDSTDAACWFVAWPLGMAGVIIEALLTLWSIVNPYKVASVHVERNAMHTLVPGEKEDDKC